MLCSGETEIELHLQGVGDQVFLGYSCSGVQFVNLCCI